MKYHFIYLTTNLINSRRYIGKKITNNIDDGYLGSGVVLKQAIEKYGRENFKREILEFCDSNVKLNEREKFWIKEYDAVNDKSFYNLREGGDGGKLSQESIEKMRKTIKENPRIHSQKERDFISKLHKGRKRKPETCKRLSIANTGKIRSIETKMKDSLIKKEYYKTHSSHNKGVKLSDEKKNEISLKSKKAWEDPIIREKYINSFKNRIKIQCPYCLRFVDKNTSKIWHFDNCLKNPEFKGKRKSLIKSYNFMTPEFRKRISETLKNKPKVKCLYCDFESNNKGLLNRWHNENCKAICKV